MTSPPLQKYFPYEIQSTIANLPNPNFKSFQWRRDVGSENGRVKVVTFTPGNDSCIVMIPGLNGTWQTWSPLLEAMAGTGKDYGTIVILDFTCSYFPSSATELSRISCALTTYLIAQRYRSVDLVGHSTGGCIASFLASTSDASELRISHLYLICGLFVNLFRAAHAPLLLAWSKGETGQALVRLRLLSAAGPLSTIYLRFLSRSEAMSRRALGKFFASPKDAPISAINNILSSFNVRTVRETLAVGRAYDYAAIYTGIKVPTTAIIGKDDPLVTTADVRSARKMIDGLVCAIVERAGHFPHIERPKETLEVLELNGLGENFRQPEN